MLPCDGPVNRAQSVVVVVVVVVMVVIMRMGQQCCVPSAELVESGK